MPEQERAVTTLTYISGFTQEEIAAFLEVPATTVNNRLYAARQRLKKELLDMARGELNEQRPSKNNAFAERAADQITALRTLHDALAAPVCDVLTEVLKDDVSVKVVSVNHTLCVEVVRWFRNPCCTYTFRPLPAQPRIFFEIDMELAACLVGRNIGRGDELRVVDVCQLAQEEMPGLHQVAKKIMSHVVKLWEGILDMEIIEPELETGTVLMIAHPEGKQMEPDEPVFHVKFEVRWDGRESSIDLCYPAPSLAAGLARLQTSAT